ncbi:hypothetical protein LXL04_030600 [Taraxacum kok-saghyz]
MPVHRFENLTIGLLQTTLHTVQVLKASKAAPPSRIFRLFVSKSSSPPTLFIFLLLSEFTILPSSSSGAGAGAGPTEIGERLQKKRELHGGKWFGFVTNQLIKNKKLIYDRMDALVL